MIPEEISIGGDTKLIDEFGNSFIIIEKDISKTEGYLAFKYVCQKDNVYVFRLNTDEEMYAFYEKYLKLGFKRHQDEFSHIPIWIQRLEKNRILKCQVIYENKIKDEKNWYNEKCIIYL